MFDPSDKVIAAEYGDPLTRVKNAGPYQRYPERSSWDERETRQRPDGSTYGVVRLAQRWGSSFSYGPWRPEARPGDSSKEAA